MVKFDKIDQKFERLFTIGDIHGNFGHISWLIKRYEIHDAIILQVGDFGVGFSPRVEAVEFKAMNVWLKKHNCYIVAIRGNHDDPVCFKNDRKGHIILLDDYTILSVEVGGKPLNVLGIGGAISIDRMVTIPRGHYFPGEVIKFETDPEELDRIRDVDIVLTHTSPDFAFPFWLTPIAIKYMNKDLTLRDEIAEERKQLRNLMNQIIIRNPKLKVCYYGHFHVHNQPPTYYKGVEFRLLGAEEMREYNAETYSYFEDDNAGT